MTNMAALIQRTKAKGIIMPIAMTELLEAEEELTLHSGVAKIPARAKDLICRDKVI